MKITDKTFPVDMADAFEQGFRKAVEAGSEVFAFDYEGDSADMPMQHRTPANCHPQMKCVVLLWPAALADLLIEGVPVVRAEMEKVAAGLIDVAVKQTGPATETVVK